MSSKKFTAEEKMAIVIEGLKGKKTVAQICREHGISQSQYYKWRDRFLQGGLNALESGYSSEVNKLQSKIEELERVIGKQTIIIETLKKTIIR